MVDRVVFLDSSVLGLITNPRLSAEADACRRWMQTLLNRKARIYLPEIADYELRRELIRAGKKRGLEKLEDLHLTLNYLPLDTFSMRLAAELWAKVRQMGKPTAGDKTLDADAILAGQAHSLQPLRPIAATTNVRHLQRLVEADDWNNIAV